jgi:hypothetical protein
MANWKYEIDISQYIIEDGDFKDFALAANNIAKEFRKLPATLFENEFSVPRRPRISRRMPRTRQARL